MPSLVYRARHDPPRWWEHAAAHPIDIAVAVASTGLGIMTVLTVHTDIVTSPAGELMPWPVLVLLGTFMATGGLLTIVGTMGRHSTLAKAHLLVRSGMIAQAVGWTVRTVVVLAAPGPVWGSSALVSACLALGCMGRWAASLTTANLIIHDVKTKIRRPLNRGWGREDRE